MSAIKFKHVFAALLVLSALSAFVIPQRYTARAQPQVQSLFQPVAKPVRSIAGWVNERLIKPPAKEARDVATLAAENEELKLETARLTHLLGELVWREAQWKPLGPIRESCTPLKVVGPDTGGRESLLLPGSTFEGLSQGQFVLFSGGVAGLLDKPPGALGSQVRLITDPGMRVEGYFAGFRNNRLASRQTAAVLFVGIGDGAMRCEKQLTMEEIRREGVELGDGVFLRDKEWDERLHGLRLGKVVRIEPHVDAPLYADIRVEPTSKLLRLRDVMVLTK
jgi:cell shape-determining protein MreC